MTEYRKDPRGFLVRITPKTFRRGRIRWVAGVMNDPKRVKYHSKKA